MPNVFEKLGIRFLYPDNWTLDEDEALAGNSSVTVQSPSGAFWSVVLHPYAVDPEESAAAALKTLQAEYRDSEAEPASEMINGQELRGYDLSFFYLDFTNTAVIRAFRAFGVSCLILCQAEDRDYENMLPVFRAITTSMLSALKETPRIEIE